MSFHLPSLAIFITLIYSGAASATATADAKAVRDLEGARFILFTNPEKCRPCGVLEEKLAKSGQDKKIRVSHNGLTVLLDVEKYDPWKFDGDFDSEVGNETSHDEEAWISELKEIGYKDAGIPQFSIVKGHEVLGAGTPFIIESISDEVAQSLLIKSNEDTYNYANRVFNYFDLEELIPADLSKSILLAADFLGEDVKTNNNLNPELGITNLIVLGTAQTPLDNAIFTPVTINNIITKLNALVSKLNSAILFGSGSKGRDTIQVRPEFVGVPFPEFEESEEGYELYEKEHFRRRELIRIDQFKSIGSTTRENLATIFEASARVGAKRNLLVFVGHGDDQGADAWFSESISPRFLKQQHFKSGVENILVSGNCHGGVMAQSVSCAFMAAPPELPASGCWDELDEGAKEPDYLNTFFAAINEQSADFNKDGNVSFLEAHSFAVINGNTKDVPYTTEDDLARNYFKQNPNMLENMSQGVDIGGLAKVPYADPSERALMGFLLSVQYEEGSEEEDARALRLDLIKQRLIYRGLMLRSPEYRGLLACQSQSVIDFIQTQ